MAHPQYSSFLPKSFVYLPMISAIPGNEETHSPASPYQGDSGPTNTDSQGGYEHPRICEKIGPKNIPSAPQQFQLPVLCLVLITLLNDGCIISIAYDNVAPSRRPTQWNLGELIGIAVTIGSVACVAILSMLILGLHALSESEFERGDERIRT